ncbi:hypothetical protein TNCV_2709011 [Trichonephila clavipes]|nr:hypothetical protein TNCV_2709011 [Trichonephila clavipes]
MQSAVSKSCRMMADVQEVGKNNSRNPKSIEKRLHRYPRLSLRQIDRAIRINDRSMRRIDEEFELKYYKLRQVPLLTEKNKLERLQRS